MGSDLRKEAFINLCYAIFIHAPYFTYIALSYDIYFQFMIVFINVYRHFHLVMMAGEEIDYFRLVITPGKPQGCPAVV